MEAVKGASEIIYTAHTFISFKAQNGSTTLIEGQVALQHKDDNVELIYEIFKVIVVHDPPPEIRHLSLYEF